MTKLGFIGMLLGGGSLVLSLVQGLVQDKEQERLINEAVDERIQERLINEVVDERIKEALNNQTEGEES